MLGALRPPPTKELHACGGMSQTTVNKCNNLRFGIHVATFCMFPSSE